MMTAHVNGWVPTETSTRGRHQQSAFADTDGRRGILRILLESLKRLCRSTTRD